MTDEQIQAIKDEIAENEFNYLGSEEAAEHRKDFESAKEKLRKKWAEENGKPWPTYKEDLINPDTKKVTRKAGQNYDAHEIIPNSYGGPLEWWNIHPARAPQHQNIHRADGPFQELFPLANPGGTSGSGGE